MEYFIKKKVYRVVFFSALLLLIVNNSHSQDSVRPEIQRICKTLTEDDGLLHLGGRVGYSLQPERNKYVRKYKRFTREAKEEELIKLTNNPNKTIALYAYSALYERNYPYLKSIFLKNTIDTSFIWSTGGCTGVLWRVNQFMLDRLNPQYSKGVAYLSKEEFDLYSKQIEK